MIELTKEEVEAMVSQLQKLPFEQVANVVLFLDSKLKNEVVKEPESETEE